MRALVLRVLTVGTLSLVFYLGTPAGAAAQQREPRGVASVLDPLIATQVEALLAAPNTLLVTDYYYIDTRFGPNLRIDAVIIEAIGSPMRAKGLRVQVRDQGEHGVLEQALDRRWPNGRRSGPATTIGAPPSCPLPAQAASDSPFASRRACRGRISRRDSWIRSPHQSTSASLAR